MRITMLSAAILVLGAGTTFGQKAGDRVVVTAESAQLRANTESTGSVPKGVTLTVQDVNGTWLWVVYANGKTTSKGWLASRDVIAFDKALDFVNASPIFMSLTSIIFFSAMRTHSTSSRRRLPLQAGHSR